MPPGKEGKRGRGRGGMEITMVFFYKNSVWKKHALILRY